MTTITPPEVERPLKPNPAPPLAPAPTAVPAPEIAERLGLGASAKRSAHLRRWLVWAVAVLAVIAIAAAWLAHRGTSSVQYATQAVQRGDLTVAVSATGSLAPTNEVEVSSELSGIVATVAVNVDQRVVKGQLLAQLDTTKLATQALQSQASLEAAQAQLQQKQATVEEARAQLARLEQVYKASDGRVPSQQELDAQRATAKRAEADQANAQASVSQAQAALRTYRTDLGKMVIRSPINGVVLTRSVDPGQTVAASFTAPVLFKIAEDLTKMELTVDVDEADVGRVQRGQEATFTVDAYPDSVFRARVAEVRFASQTVSGVVTYPTVLYVSNPHLLLRPGMTATAKIVVQSVTNAILVPNAALRFQPATQTASTGGMFGRLMGGGPAGGASSTSSGEKGQRVWVLRDGAPAAVVVRTGVSDGSLTQIVGGDIEAGKRVIVDVSSGAK